MGHWTWTAGGSAFLVAVKKEALARDVHGFVPGLCCILGFGRVDVVTKSHYVDPCVLLLFDGEL